MVCRSAVYCTRRCSSTAAAGKLRKSSDGHTIEIHCTPGVSAVSTRAALGDHQHGEVIAINESDIKQVYATRAIEGELSKGGWRRGDAAQALKLSGAAVAGEAGEFSSPVLCAVGSAPEASAPAHRPQGPLWPWSRRSGGKIR